MLSTKDLNGQYIVDPSNITNRGTVGNIQDAVINALLTDASSGSSSALAPDNKGLINAALSSSIGQMRVDAATLNQLNLLTTYAESVAAAASVRMVACADKLHNARSIVADLRAIGPAMFDRFTGGREGTLWYYEALAAVFREVRPRELAAELGRTVETMRVLAG